MKRLLLLRHAKSLRDDARKDKERPLNDRGRRDAPRIGGYMHHKRYLPELTLCSSAKRTVETWQLLAQELDCPAEARFMDSLYMASAENILKSVASTEGRWATLLAIGHNPGLEECALMLAREPEKGSERERLAELRTKYPTCALAALEFDVESWEDIEPGRGALIDYVRPKDLKDR